MKLNRYSWIGTHWTPSRSIDSWNLYVQKVWPGAYMDVLDLGAIWWHGGRIVAECRPRNGWPPREAWLAEK